MNFNASKCQTLHIGKGNPQTIYQINNENIESVKEVRDLGVVMDSNLSFARHTDLQVSKANRILGLVRRAFEYLSKDMLVRLYKALIRPHLEYCSTVVYPRTKAQLKSVEGVQRRATKLVSELRDKPYDERLRSLALPSMKYRLRRGDMIQIWKILHNKYSVEVCTLPIASTITRGHPLKLEKTRCITNTRLLTFPHRAVNDWNALPSHVVTATSVNAFKNALDKEWKQFIYVYDQ
jgi:ribonucleases P/MRP protein subunit RPP40